MYTRQKDIRKHTSYRYTVNRKHFAQLRFRIEGFRGHLPRHGKKAPAISCRGLSEAA